MENPNWLVEITGEHAMDFVPYNAWISENQYLFIILYSTYCTDICILHIIKVILILVLTLKLYID